MVAAAAASQERRAPRVDLGARAFVVVVAAMVAGGAAVLLIDSAADVLGRTPRGFTAAILLEAAILGCSVYPARSLGAFLMARLGAVGLAVLSLTILHAGVANDAAEATAAATAADDGVADLKAERDRLAAFADSLPPDHLTKRQAALARLSELTSRLGEARARVGEGDAVQSITRTYRVEGLLRCALLFIEIVFAHALVTSIRRSNASEGRKMPRLLANHAPP